MKQDAGQLAGIAWTAYAPLAPGREESFRPDDVPIPLDRRRRPLLTRGVPSADARLYDGPVLDGRALEYRASEARFRALARLAPIGIFRRDTTGAYPYVNDAWCAITGISPEQALGSECIPHVCSADRERVGVEWEQALSAEAPLAIEYGIEHSDGTTIWLCERAVVERDDAGRMVGYVGTITDVTDRKKADDERQRLFLAAAEASRAKDDFLATVSHELRSPLSSILLWMGLLRRGNLDGANAARAVGAVERNAKLLSRLIEDLLDVARIDSGNLSVQLTRVDLHPLVAAALDAFRPAAAAKHLQLEARLDRRKLTAQGDPVRLHQILNNLITNAIKFTPAGGRITVELAGLGQAARITVSDTGMGIAPDFVPRVFERFQQAAVAAGGARDGLGLGLWIVQALVERHGGTIAAASPGLGRGATFSVTLPLSPEEAGMTDGSAASAT